MGGCFRFEQPVSCLYVVYGGLGEMRYFVLNFRFVIHALHALVVCAVVCQSLAPTILCSSEDRFGHDNCACICVMQMYNLHN